LRYPVTAVVHGHAHHGRPEGKLRDGVPVYNVAQALLRQAFPDRRTFRLLEVPRGPGDDSAPACGVVGGKAG